MTGGNFLLRLTRALLLWICKNEVVQSVGGDFNEFGDAKRHGVAKKPERDRHSIVSGGDRNRLAGSITKDGWSNNLEPCLF